MNTMLKSLLVLAILALPFAGGCGSKADETKPMDQVKAEAQKLSIDDLKAIALDYKEAMEKKAQEIKAEGEKLKDIPLTEALGEKSKQLRDKIAELGKSAEELAKRFEVYADEFVKKGGKMSDLEVK